MSFPSSDSLRRGYKPADKCGNHLPSLGYGLILVCEGGGSFAFEDMNSSLNFISIRNNIQASKEDSKLSSLLLSESITDWGNNFVNRHDEI